MNHLIYEFSQECLLCFVEMVQWKKIFHKELIKFDTNQLDIIQDDNEDDINLQIFNQEDDVLNLTQEKLKTKHYKSMDLPNISSKFKPKLFNKYSNSIDSTSQQQQYGISSKFDDDIDEHDKILTFEFPNIVPQSSIINDVDITKYAIYSDDDDEFYRNDNDDDDDDDIDDFNQQRVIMLNSMNEEEKLIYQYKIMAHALYEKYVADGSKLEININHKQRKKLNDLMSDIDFFIEYNIESETLFELYDYCIQEMYQLMIASFNRFKTTQRFLDLDKAKIFDNI